MLRRSGQVRVKTLLDKVTVEAENIANACLAHHLKASAIHQAQLLSAGRQHSCECCIMDRFRDPLDCDQGHDVLMKGAYGVESETSLKQSARLYNDVVAGDHGNLVYYNVLPLADRITSVLNDSMQYCIECQGV